MGEQNYMTKLQHKTIFSETVVNKLGGGHCPL